MRAGKERRLADELGCAPVQVSPDTLYLIEGGGGQGGPFAGMCWGDGFITNKCARSRRQVFMQPLLPMLCQPLGMMADVLSGSALLL